MSEASDLDALLRVASGDTRAVACLYQRYARHAFGVALRVVNDPALAEDLVHDAFLVLRERAGRYRPDRGSVLAWFTVVVRNLAIDRLRARERRRALAQAWREDCTSGGACDVGSTPRRLQRMLGELPCPQRETIELAFFEGLSYPEIAARSGVPLGTVKSRAARAMNALRAALACAA